MNNLIQSECERQIKKVTRTIIILITLNICPVYAGTDHTFAHGQNRTGYTFRFWVTDFCNVCRIERKKWFLEFPPVLMAMSL